MVKIKMDTELNPQSLINLLSYIAEYPIILHSKGWSMEYLKVNQGTSFSSYLNGIKWLSTKSDSAGHTSLRLTVLNCLELSSIPQTSNNTSKQTNYQTYKHKIAVGHV